MQILFIPKLNMTSTSKPSSRDRFNTGMPVFDTVSFGAIKKAKLQGFSLLAAELFKAPLEKFNSEADLQAWAAEKLDEHIDLEKYKTTAQENKERIKRLTEWKQYITQENDVIKNDKALALIIFSSITKELKPNNRELPPLLDKRALADTWYGIKKELETDSKYQFNFIKKYKETVATLAAGLNKPSDTGTTATLWVHIPSKIHDPENFEANVEKLIKLSHDGWCTKSGNAEPYLAQGDFHVYLEKGRPKVGIRFVGDEMQEIQGERNDSKIPLAYYDEINKYITENRFKGADEQLKKAKMSKAKLKKAKAKLKPAIESKDYIKVFEYFDNRAKKLPNGMLKIADYIQPDEGFTFGDLGIKENDMFKYIQEISGNAFFRKSQVTDLGQLHSIGCDAYFENSQVTDLGQLHSIGRYANFQDSKVTDLGQLRYIDGFADFRNSQVSDLEQLYSIGGYANFENSKVTSLGQLHSIGGHANFRKSQVTDLGQLHSIGEYINFLDSQVKNLGKLKIVKGDVYIDKNCTLDFSNIKVGGEIRNL